MTTEPDRDTLVRGLADLGAVAFGRFTLASGMEAPFYIDLRLLVSQPHLLRLAAAAYAPILMDLTCDRIAAVPYAGLPIGTALSLHKGIPLIYPRKEAKSYGQGRVIEGVWKPGERVVLIEDVMTSGGSILKARDQLTEAGLVVEDAIVLIDREQGGRTNLAARGIRAHAVMGLAEVLTSLVHQKRLESGVAQEIVAYVSGHQTHL